MLEEKRPLKWTKSPPEVIARFEVASPDDPRVVRRPMFGYPALYLGGNMFASTFEDTVVVRLSEDDRRRAMEAKALPFEPMPGRVMKGYVALRPDVVANPEDLAQWLIRARDYAATLPAKEPKKKRRSK